jgi:hypothetical protein
VKKPKRKYWYRIYVGECPVCGRYKGWRERVYGKRPKDIEKRYVQLSQNETYDHCIGF